MSELMMQTGGQAVALPDNMPLIGGLDMLGTQDLTLPYIRLIQPISDDAVAGKHRPGELVHSITGEVYPQPLEFIPVLVSVTRSRFVNRTRVCFSADDRIGVGDPGGQCATCPFSQWTRGQNGQPDEPPKCTRGYQYVVLLPGHEPLPVALILAKTSAKTAKSLNYMLKAYARKGSVFAVEAKMQSNAKGTYFVFDVRRSRDLTPEELKQVVELRNSLAGQIIVVEQDASDFDFEGAGAAEAPPTNDDPY